MSSVKTVIDMPLMTRKIFHELAEVKQHPCVSIYIPTERVGENKKAWIRFKNLVQETRNELHERGMQGQKILEFTQPLDMLLDDSEVWRHMSDGLAVFLSPGKFAYSTFPIRFKDYAEVNAHFYLLPLMPVFNGDGRFFILALSLNQVRLLEGTRDHVIEIPVDDLVPQTMEETVGADYEQKSIQYRTGQTGGEQGLYHGQGRGKDFKKEEVAKHLREVDRGLAGLLQGHDAPLVVAGVDYVFAIYRDLCAYNRLFKKHISGNPDEMHMQELHQKAWPLLEDYFMKHRRDTLRQYDFLASKGRTTSILADIVFAADEGRVDSLFVAKDQRAYGLVDRESHAVQLQEEKTKENHCLLDRAAKATFMQGGRVYLLDWEEMPEKESVATATLRY